MADPNVEQILTEQKELEEERQNFEDVVDDIIQYVFPRRTETDINAEKGTRHDESIYDTTALDSHKRLADGLQGQLIASSYKWFGLRMENPMLSDVPAIRQWLQTVETILYAALNRSNFYRQMHEYFMDAAGFGTATIYSQLDRKRNRLAFSTRHWKEIYLAQDEYGFVDKVYRKYKWTARQWVLAFPDTVDAEIQRISEKTPEQEFECLHVVYPRDERDPNKRDPSAMRWGSQYIDPAHKKSMGVSGYRHNPYHVWRFYRNSDEVYGRSPAWNCLADVKRINDMAKTAMWAAQMSVKPPLLVRDDLKGRLRFVPGGQTHEEAQYMQGPYNSVRPIVTGINYPIEREREEQVRQAIRRAFMVDFFSVPEEERARIKTAYEVRQMREEKSVALGPTINGLENETLDPLIDRIFDIGMEEGWFPPPPSILFEMQGGTTIKVDYIGPLALLQRQFFRNQPYRNTLQEMYEIFKIQPASMDVYDWDDWARNIGESNDMPQSSVRDEKMLAAIRNQRAKQQQAAQQAAMMESMGKTASNLNETKQPNSMLDEVEKLSGGGA